MKKHFNAAGPIEPEDHYHIDPIHQLDWEDVVSGQEKLKGVLG